MQLRSCIRGSDDLRPVLRVSETLATRSVLTLKPTEFAHVHVALPARYAAVLIILAERWFDEHEEVDPFRGWVTAAEIAQELPKFPSSNGPVLDTTPVTYIHEIGVKIREALERAGVSDRYERVDPIHRGGRGLGYRIHIHGLEVRLRQRDAVRN